MQPIASQFARYRFPLLCQTASAITIADHDEAFLNLPALGPFDFTSPADAGFLLLLRQIGKRVVEWHVEPDSFLTVVDEGRMKRDTFVEVPVYGAFARGHGVYFKSSAATPPLQLADFAAFALNRTQWLLAKESRSSREHDELAMYAAAQFNWLNIPTNVIDLKKWTGDSFDALHRDDRRAKGLE